jgi:hypothetical protein
VELYPDRVDLFTRQHCSAIAMLRFKNVCCFATNPLGEPTIATLTDNNSARHKGMYDTEVIKCS